MIKIGNGIYYIASGEICYIAKLSGNDFKHVWFGRRVEPEDDLEALGNDFYCDEFSLNCGLSESAKSDFESGAAIDVKTGKRVKLDFKFVSAVVEPKKQTELPSLRGGETLCVTLAAGSITAELYYTAYSRGGIARRTVIKNDGKATVRFRASSVRLATPKVAGEFGGDGKYNFFGVDTDCGAYGFAALYGAPMLCTCEKVGGGAVIELSADENVELAPGEAYYSPETLCAYSDCGKYGLMRVFHDIVRECAIPEKYSGLRRPVVMESASGDAHTVARLGADVMLSSDLADGAECKNAGIAFGLKFKKGSNYGVIADAVKSSGAEYVSLSFDNKTYKDELYKYGVYKKLCEDFPELIIEGERDLGSLCYCPFFVATAYDATGDEPITLFAPPCATSVRSSDKTKLKTDFDVSSIGVLGYKYRLDDLGENLSRAIRAQILSYQDDASLVMSGDLYRRDGLFSSVSKDKSKAYAVFIRKNESRIYFDGLDIHNIYLVRELNKTFSGAALKSVGLSVSEIKEGDTAAFHLSVVADFN